MGIRFLTSGESHGKCLNAIIEGFPSNFNIDIDFINSELSKRQMGYGRGGRMAIESDKVEIKSGVRFGKTLGSPICLEIENKDWENWKYKMSPEKVECDFEKIVMPRPGHADLAGLIKYKQDDIRNILERSSARETAARVAVGAICQSFLKSFGIEGEARVLSVNKAIGEDNIKAEIDRAKAEGDTLGGRIEIKFKNLPIGLGSYVHWDKRLDGLLAQALMSIPAIKSVEIGLGVHCADNPGSKVHDEMFYEDGKIKRKTNNAGGIEGGMTNGEDVVLYVSMKPIPTMRKPLKSVNLKTKENAEAHFERSDVCAIEACATVALNMCAIVLMNAFLDKFGGDSYNDVKVNYEKK